jgi:hypothetical protein
MERAAAGEIEAAGLANIDAFLCNYTTLCKSISEN